MIKETELRIGNILLLDNIKVIRLLWVKNNKCCIMEVGVVYPSAIVDIERLQPIELTEEILLKLNNNETLKQYKELILNGVIFELKSNNLLYFTAGEGCSISDPIEYLHELQNFVFLFSKKELEINM